MKTCMSGQPHVASSLPEGNSPEAGWAQSRFERGGEEKNSFIAPVGSRTPVVQPVA
jgi:hypothetical protein